MAKILSESDLRIEQLQIAVEQDLKDLKQTFAKRHTDTLESINLVKQQIDDQQIVKKMKQESESLEKQLSKMQKELQQQIHELKSGIENQITIS